MIIDYGPAVTAALNALPMGELAFNPPSLMEAGVMDQVGVRMTRLPNPTVTQGMPGSGAPQTQNLQVATFMSARLTGEKQAFDIEALSDDVQLVPDVGYTQWVWNVTPTASGRHYLDLSVSAIVEVPGAGEKKRSVPEVHRRITVEVNFGYTFQKFTTNNWQWIIATVVAAAGAVVGLIRAGAFVAVIRWYRRSQKRRSRSDNHIEAAPVRRNGHPTGRRR